MKLTSQLIYDKLNNYHPGSLYSTGKKVLIRAPLIYNGQHMMPGYAYILTPQQLKELPSNQSDILLICSGGGKAFAYMDVIALEEKISVFELLQVLSLIFQKFQDWDDALSECSNDRDGIRRMLDLSTSILGGNLLLVDSYYNFVAVTSETRKYPDFFNPEDQSRPSHSMLTGLVDDPVIYKIMDHRGALLYQGNGTESNKDCMFVNLFRDGENQFYYRLLLLRDDYLYPEWTGYLLEHLANRIHRISKSLSLFSSSDQIHLNLKNLLKQMLDGTEENYSVISTTLQTVSWTSEDQMQTFIFYPFLKGQSPGSSSYILNQLELIFPGSYAILLDDTIVMVRNITRSSQNDAQIRDHLSVFLKENLYKVGISSPTENFGQLRAAYVQANSAYQLGCARHPHYWYYKFEDYVLDYMILESTAKMPPAMLCQNAFLKLKACDQANNTQYLHTLLVYIQEKFNATHAAAKLYIHRTTFLDRLDRIKKITSLDLNDWNTLLHLMLSYRLMESE